MRALYVFHTRHRGTPPKISPSPAPLFELAELLPLWEHPCIKNLTTLSDHDGPPTGMPRRAAQGASDGRASGGVVAWQATEQSWDDPRYGPAMRLAIDARGRCRGTSWGQTRRRGGRERGQRGQAQGGT